MPNPRSGESEQEYIGRFMASAEARKDFPDEKQRAAVAYSKFRERANKDDSLCRSCGAAMAVNAEALVNECAYCGDRTLGHQTKPIEDLDNLCRACRHVISPEHDDFGCHVTDCGCTMTGAGAIDQIKSVLANAHPLDESAKEEEGAAQEYWGTKGDLGIVQDSLDKVKKEIDRVESERRNAAPPSQSDAKRLLDWAAGETIKPLSINWHDGHTYTLDQLRSIASGVDPIRVRGPENSNTSAKEGDQCALCESNKITEPHRVKKDRDGRGLHCEFCGREYSKEKMNAEGRRYRFKDANGEIVEIMAMSDEDAWTKLSREMSTPQSDMRDAGVKMLANATPEAIWDLAYHPSLERLLMRAGLDAGLANKKWRDLPADVKAKIASLLPAIYENSNASPDAQAAMDAFAAHQKECSQCMNAADASALCAVGSQLLVMDIKNDGGVPQSTLGFQQPTSTTAARPKADAEQIKRLADGIKHEAEEIQAENYNATDVQLYKELQAIKAEIKLLEDRFGGLSQAPDAERSRWQNLEVTKAGLEEQLKHGENQNAQPTMMSMREAAGAFAYGSGRA